jgi:hypothetical protein
MKGVLIMTRTEMYKALEGKKVACMEGCLISDVGIFHKGRMCFTVKHFEPLNRIEYDSTTYFLQKGDYIEDLGEYILIRRGTQEYMFIFRA